jgi:hypothetical protein
VAWSVTISGELLDYENYVYQIICPVGTIFVELILHIKIPFSPGKSETHLKFEKRISYLS